MPPQTLTILGSTGSIGQSALAVIRLHPERYRIFALSAHRQWKGLCEQCREFQPEYAVVGDAKDAACLRNDLRDSNLKTEVLYGPEALCQVAADRGVDTVVAAIVGAAGLSSALAAAMAGKRILLANKESLVMAGALFMQTAKKNGAVILPIDSEHNAIFQSLPRDFSGDWTQSGVHKLWLTASGGPFLDFSAEALTRVTPEQAVKHPRWSMGQKISVDSATLMNKGLEVIEAHWLFNAPPESIEVVVHPQSLVHSLVEYVDGSMLAQLGNPDMRVPIAHALAWPERVTSGVSGLDLFQAARLDFFPPDTARFPCPGLAYAALAAGGTAPAILNAANEVAVAAFLERRIAFSDIFRCIDAVLNAMSAMPADTLEAIQSADATARRLCAAQSGVLPS
ncbi:MAG: 1-deoxy-D-xylulose-5-phosphate reductoisomerase [Zoogloeaceae bacterium]|jgi:1-deoxy-D-xylulose-5-phosphate reductoisomerase|nr:1-deoxy-D-xylulose-5-phosphate reductoisomerase [Zoogloeaceae bacterium]